MKQKENSKPPPNCQITSSFDGTQREGTQIRSRAVVFLLRAMVSRDSDSIQISDPNSIVKHKENEEGLWDCQKGEDIVNPVLSTQKYGNWQYDMI